MISQEYLFYPETMIRRKCILPILPKKQEPSGCATTSLFCVLRGMGLLSSFDKFVKRLKTENVPLIDKNPNSFHLIGLVNWCIENDIYIKLWQEGIKTSINEEVEKFQLLVQRDVSCYEEEINHREMLKLLRAILEGKAGISTLFFHSINFKKDIQNGRYLLPVLVWQKWDSSFVDDSDYPNSSIAIKHIPVIFGFENDNFKIMDPYQGLLLETNINKIITSFGINKLIIEIGSK